MYGFIPRTYCGERVGALSPKAIRGDGDPMDICVVSERPITRAEVILSAKIVGALQMLDGGEADDKIIAVLENDNYWGNVEDISGLPEILIERLQHYFSTYKLIPGQEKRVSIEKVLNNQQAQLLISAAMEDYRNAYGAQMQGEKG